MRRQSLTEEERALEELHRLRRAPAPRKKRSPWGRYIAAGLLALACVASTELLACRFFEPVLYETIMTPVRRTAQAVRTGVCKAGAAVSDAAGSAASAVSGAAGSAAAILAEQAGETRDAFRAWMEDLAAPPPESPEPGLLPETESTALAQPELPAPAELLDPLISDLIDRKGRKVLTGGGVDVVYYNQTDEARASQMYGSDRLSTHGCGPTAMAMAVSTLTGEDVDPADMAALCVDRGYWCKNHGSYLSMVQGVAEIFGLECQSVNLTDLDEDWIHDRLSSGSLLVALMTKGHFTKGGHFILLRGMTLSGEILVADPASQDRSLIPWDLSLILSELSPSRHDGAPLWLLTPPPQSPE